MQSVDLFPLILAHAGVEAPAGIDGLAWGKQRNELLSWLYVSRTGAEYYGPRFKRELRSMESAGFKLIESTHEPPKLFDAARDRFELDDLSERETDQVAEMLASIGPRIGFAMAGGGEQSQASQETLDQLRALGYIR
jgi:arylsulfatase A-like enzyme